MNRRTRQSGFALLIVLVLVIIAGAVMAGFARRSLVSAVEAQGSADALQRKWAVTSLETSLLPRV